MINRRRVRRLASLVLKHRKCTFCNWVGFRFDPFGNRMVRRNDAECPACGSLERHRGAFLLLRDKIPPRQKVLHVAAEPAIIPWLVSLSSEYLSVDLYHPAMRRMDVTDIDLPDASLTLVWCSHVLEHIEEDRKALSEFFRVLEPGGMLVLQVPISGETTFEDRSITTKAQRLEAFLQEDHVRLYGLDLAQRTEEYGFQCEVLSTASLPPADQKLYSVMTPLYREAFVCRKPM
jgi:SAM-dependent methyltransferase